MHRFHAAFLCAASVLLPAALAVSLIPGSEPVGFPPAGYEDRIIMWEPHEPQGVWFANQPADCAGVDIWNGLYAALFADGTVLVWGPRYDSRHEPPGNVTNAAAADLGGGHILALLPDGAVAAWGDGTYGQTNVPDHVTNAVAVAAGECHSLALLSDGTVAAWGDSSVGGQTDVPASVTNAAAVAAGGYHSLALLADGTVAAWGYNGSGQCDVPASVTNAVAVAAGFSHSLALLADGTVSAWGANEYHQCVIPPSLSGKAVSVIGATWANTSWAVAADGGLHVWGDADPPPVPHAQSPLFMRFMLCAAEPACGGCGITNLAVVRVASGGASPDDADGDGLSGSDELLLHNTDPSCGDTDRDELPDGWEIANGLDPLDPADAILDPDGDGVSTADEVNALKTSPFLYDSDGDGLSDGLEAALCYALFIDGPPSAPVLTWAVPPSGSEPAPAVAAGATKWDRSVVFRDGSALQRRWTGDIAFQNVHGLSCGSYQTLFTDAQGGALGVVGTGAADPYFFYEGAFGAVPVQSAPGFCHAIALRADGTVTNIGAFADESGDVHTVAPPAPEPSLTSIVPGTGAGDFLAFAVPAATTGAPPASVQAAAGAYTALALGQDGRPAMWGRPYRNILDVPPDLSNAVKVAGGVFHSAALLSNGTVRAWGRNTYGQLNVPAGLSNVIDIACTDYATVALRSDTTLAAWGFWNDTVVTDCPTNPTGCAALFAAADAAWGITTNGQIFGWGNESMPVSLLPWRAVSAAFANPSYADRRGVALVCLGTDPLAADSDGDGLSDGLECTLAFDPLDPADGADADANGLPDIWETLHFGAAGQDPHADPDGDGIPNHAECRLGGDPRFSVRAASASTGWHGFAWNAFPGAASYSVAVTSGGQSVTTLLTAATSAVLDGRLPGAACAVTVKALSSAGQPLRTASESWEQPAAGSGVTAWKITPAFTLHRPAGYAFTNLLDLTLAVNRAAQWDDLFVSSAPSAGGWSLAGATLAWHDGGAQGAASASPADSLRLAAAAVGSETLTLRLDMPAGEGVTRSATPLYLLRWAPELSFEIPEGTGSQAYVIATERRAVLAENGTAVPLPVIAVTGGGYPHLASPPGYPRPLPVFSSETAALTNASVAVPGPGPLAAALAPGAAGAGTVGLGSAGVPPPAQPAPPPAQPPPAPAPFTLGVSCVSHTVGHFWDVTGDSCDCAYPSGLFCSYGNLCGCGYSDDAGDGLSTRFILRINAASGEIQSTPAANVQTAFNGTDPHPVSITWAGGVIFSGAVSPKPPDFDSRCHAHCTNAVDSCGGGDSPCGCGDGGCGDEGPALGSARFLLKLGASGARASEGALYFDTPTPAVSRANLRLFGDGTAVSLTNAGGIASVTTALGRTVTAADTADGFTLTVASPLPGEDRVWEITNPGGDPSAARFVKNPGLASEQAFLLRAPDGNGWWRLETLGPGGAVRSVLAKRPPAGADDTAEELTLEPGGGDPGSPLAGFRRLAHTRTVYTSVNGFRRAARVETWNGAAGAFETISHTYAPATGDAVLNTRPWLTVRPDGSWEHLAYDAIGRVVRRAAPAVPGIDPPSGDPVLFDPSAVPGLRVTAYTYPPDYTNALLPGLARTAAESLVTAEGALPLAFTWTDAAAVTNTVGGEAVPCLSNAVIRARAPGALKGDPANARSAEISCGGRREDWRRGLPVYRLSEDGLETRWRYEEGACAGGAFTPGAGGPHIRAVSVTLPASGAPVPGNAAVADIAVTDALWGHTLLAETRLPPGGDISGDPAAWPLLAWSRHAYDGTRPSLTLHSDGTFESNVWDCCRLTSATARDGAVTEHDAFPAEGVAYAREVSLAALPGADGRYPVTETFSDGLGRATNSLRAVWFNGARDAACEPLATLTAYPYGKDHLSVMTDPLGVETVTRAWRADGADVTETVTPGVTNRVTRYFDGATVEERFWDGKWTSETRSDTYGPDGCRIETAVTESSDCPAVTNSVTAYDFLGREVCVATPLGVTSNFYDGASSRVLRVTRTGSPDTLYAYDALGNLTQTALDADGDGVTELAGDDRVSASSSTFEEDAAGWWRVAASAVWPEAGSAACLTASVTRVRMTGLGAPAPSGLGLPAGALLTAQTETLDWRGIVTRASTCTDAGAASVWTVTETPGSVQPAVQKTVAGHAVSMVSSSVVTNTYAYDGFGRRVSSTDGRGSATVTAYNELGQVAFMEDAASNRTAYAYDASGRQNAVTPPLSNTVFTAYDSLGNVTSQWGGTYPVEYGYDTRNRKISMKTFRVENGNGDETLWLYDNLTGLLTNKVYADGSRVVYAYAADGRLASRVWARGVTAVYAYDAFGQVTNTAYSDDTPQVSYAYDRLGRVLSAVTGRSPSQFLIEELLPYLPPLATNIFSYSGLDLASETQNGVTVARRRDALGRDTGYGIGDGVSAAYGYDAFGRFASVTSAFHAATNVFTYGYLQGTDLINCMTNSAGIMWQRAHEQNRGLVTAVSNRVNQTLISAFDYPISGS